VRRSAEQRSGLALSVDPRVTSIDTHELVSLGEPKVDYAVRLYDAVRLRASACPFDSHVPFLLLARMLVAAQSITVSPTSQALAIQAVSAAYSAKAVAAGEWKPLFLQRLQLALRGNTRQATRLIFRWLLCCPALGYSKP
jgi:hypothetical protein